MTQQSPEPLVGRCYTKGRRHKLVIGTWDGRRLWGGPYSVPQFMVMVAVLLVMILTRSLWAHFGVWSVIPLLGVPYLAGLAVRQLHVDGRNPLLAVASAVSLVSRGPGGRLAGRPVRLGRQQVLEAACTVHRRSQGGPAPLVPDRELVPIDELLTPAHAVSPAPVPVGPAAGRVLSGAEALLASGRRTGTGV